jgi:hypothetical protein
LRGELLKVDNYDSTGAVEGDEGERKGPQEDPLHKKGKPLRGVFKPVMMGSTTSSSQSNEVTKGESKRKQSQQVKTTERGKEGLAAAVAASDVITYVRIPSVKQQLFSILSHEKEMELDKNEKQQQCHQPEKTKILQSASSSTLDIFIECHVKTIEARALERYRVLFPLLTLPQSPASLRCTMEMPGTIRRVWASHTKHQIYPTLFNHRADFSLIFSPQNPLRLEEYLYDIEIELGKPIIAECIDPISLIIIVTAAAVLVFFMLTKDLNDVDIY